MSTLLRDVITIPEHYGAEDYVLRLTDSVGHDAAQRTIDEYVVTPALADAFDRALGLVAEGIQSGVSRGAFLTGSFGSGKSHFMAVLHALLQHEPAARAKQELHGVIARHDDVLREKTILPLAFHLLGAKTMEEALFTGYLRQISELHPDAPLPAVHRSEGLLADADALRGNLGDEKFFAGLNQGHHAEPDAWSGVLGEGRWNADTYAQARAADLSDEDRIDLTTALVNTFFTSYAHQGDFVDLDTGLMAIASHAKRLGYDASVLFLDELVLWLAFSVQDKEFFARESQKLTKLVESSTGTRAIPLISFVARQMDLRRWFADSGASGNEQAALEQAFRHQEGRFGTVTLGDDNLPFVANRRLLRPKDEQAASTLTDAFDDIDRRPDVWDVLLDGVNTDDTHRGADEKAFRLTYPFSPALVSTLRSLASVMQRERTALKVMQQMLVERRDTLTIDDIIPVGEAFDFVVHGSSGQALDVQAEALFKSARKLYAEKLRPLLLSNNGVDATTPAGALPASFRTDDRLAKTLLLSAVAPNVPALKSLTASRLASLNHGSIISPVPGNEATVTLSKIRNWARDIPEIHLDGSDTNPIIRVQLSDVDYESIVERAKGEDNAGRRRELIKQLVADSLHLDLGAQDNLEGSYPYTLIWRGSRRQVDVIFGNVRDRSWLSDDHFVAKPGTWRIIIDHPFDEPGHSGSEDTDRLDELIAHNVDTQTIAWLPRFLSEDRMRELRRLVILTWLLDSDDRWRSHADHLSEEDRAVARSILESNCNTLRRTLDAAIEQAYGVADEKPGTLLDDPTHRQTFVSLTQTFKPRKPVGATLGLAFEHLVSQAFDETYPAHPKFEPGDVEVKVAQLKLVAAHIARAVADEDKRVELQGSMAEHSAVRRIAGPLGVGTGTEMHYILGDDRFTPWSQEIEKALGRRAQDGGPEPTDPVTVAELRAWIDAVEPRHGLREEVSDLIVIAWAALRQRAWYLHGAALGAVPDPGSLQGQMELRTQPMPSGADWSSAVEAAASLFGLHASPHLTAPAVADLVSTVIAKAGDLVPEANALVEALETAYGHLRIDTGDNPPQRLRTARGTAALVGRLRHLDGVPLVEALARHGLGQATTAASKSLSSAGDVRAALDQFPWNRIQPVLQAMTSEGQRADDAAAIVGRLRDALAADEIVTPASVALSHTDDDIFRWLASTSAAPQPTTPVEPGPAHTDTGATAQPAATPQSDTATRAAGGNDAEVLAAVRAFLTSHPNDAVTVTWRVQQ